MRRYFPAVCGKLKLPCGVRDKLFINPHFVIRDAGTLRWFAGLPAAFCGWMLEAVKPDRGDPPVPEGAGLTGLTRPLRGVFLPAQQIAQNSFFIFYTVLDGKNVQLVRVSCKIIL